MTPMQLATAYTVFANGGYSVTPYFIERVVDGDGVTLFEAPQLRRCEDEQECEELQLSLTGVDEQAVAGLQVQSGEATDASTQSEPEPSSVLQVIAEEEAAEALPTTGIPEIPEFIVSPRVIDERNAFIMRSIMREVIRRGTATKARALERSDIAGKTGTTNDLYDAWFTGFTSKVVSTAWVGYDEQKSLGPKETGGVAALPMWIDYMRVALNGVEEDREDQPEGVEMVRIDRKTGEIALPGSDNAFFEYFREENMPEPPKNLASKQRPRIIQPRKPESEVVLIETRQQQQQNGSGQTEQRPVVRQTQQPRVREQQAPRKVEQLF